MADGDIRGLSGTGLVARSPTFAPFRHRIFGAIWIAGLASNFGSLIQSVGASWMMTSIAPSAGMVALVQASTTLPIMLFSLASGAVADNLDRRRIMIVAQSMMLIVSAALAVLAYLGLLTPWLLLAMTFLIGCGTSLHGPAWQASVGEQVPREDLPAAVALNSIGFNIARSVGPAIGGAIVAAAGAAAAFLVNAVSYIGLIAVLVSWRRPATVRERPRETLGSAMVAGVRYATMAPAIRTVLIRGLAFGVAGSAVWALNPLVARDRLAGGPLTYGLMLGAFGAGAVLGALASTRLRQRFRNETVVRWAMAMFAVAAAGVGLSSVLPLTMLALLLGGAGWVLALSTLNVTVQLSAPRWVVARAMAIYQMMTFGGMAAGSWAWGTLAEREGLVVALLASAAAVLAGAAIGLLAPLPQVERLNLDPARNWSDPEVNVAIEDRSGPVVVTVEYRVAQADALAFMAAMAARRRIRRRDGARGWTLLQDIADPELWIERFHSATWLEHMRQHDRVTVADIAIEERVRRFHKGDAAPRVRHLLERPANALPAGTRDGRAPPAAITDPAIPSQTPLPG